MKTLSPELLAHKRGEVTTLCQLMLVRTTDATTYGFTDLDIDITYDDGDGPVLYEASQGFTPSALSAQGGLSIDNADLTGFALVDSGITEDTVRSGKLDYAEVRFYQVNYADLSMGHEWMGRGTLGEVVVADGIYKAEFRGMAQPLKQSVCDLYSLTCRAQYGDAKCGKTLEWTNGTVTAAGSDPLSEFTSTDLDQPDDYFVPGVVEWLTGPNVGKPIEVTGFAAGGAVQLLLPYYFPIEVGHTFRIRFDCNKRSDETGCKDVRRWGPDNWALHFRGEPLIPISDAVQIPGANT